MKKNNIVQPSIPSGFMELLPADQLLFNKMMSTIRECYELFGFTPIDTPDIEKAEVLLAKVGGETEKQLYRFKKGKNELALRFDLTVPLARYVSQYYSELTFPFRRCHIGKVHRGERAQRGRFREFYQCDIDIIGNGSLSLHHDAEIPSVIYFTFKSLGFENFLIRINNRKILNGFFQNLSTEVSSTEILRVVDKIEKIGEEEVSKELIELGVSNDGVDDLLKFLSIKGDNDSIIGDLKNLSIENKLFSEGVEELAVVIQNIRNLNVPENNFIIDLSIARGLDYYTGTVYETLLTDYPKIGSVCSGGRFDNLAESYTNNKLPGVGISIGLTRLFYQLKEAGIIKAEQLSLTKVLVVSLDDNLQSPFEVATQLRSAGVITEVYVENDKFSKKLSYANRKGIPYVIIIGEDERSQNKVALKDMVTGEQSLMSFDDALTRIIK